MSGLSGGVSTIGIVGTIISAYVVDRFGRRRCLIVGAFGMFAVNMIAGGLYEASRRYPEDAVRIAPAAVTCLFLFNLIYASTWGTIAFLIPTEVFPSELRAQGNGFGVTGWAIGVGTTTLADPSLFSSLQNRAYFFFAGLNLLWIVIVFLLYPETKDRSLEAINVLFYSKSPFNWAAERSWREYNQTVIPDQDAVSRQMSRVEIGLASKQHLTHQGRNEKGRPVV